MLVGSAASHVDRGAGLEGDPDEGIGELIEVEVSEGTGVSIDAGITGY